MPRTLAIGDIHGCVTSFDTLMNVVAPNRDDLIITLGDYVDRGLDVAALLDRLIRFHETHQLVAIRGNHDIMMLNAADDRTSREMWLSIGGLMTLSSYADSRIAGIPDSHWHFLRDTCVDWHETATHIFVHGRVAPGLPLDQQSSDDLFWAKVHRDTPPHGCGKQVVCGHTRQRSGLPMDLGHLICIDTGPANDGWLTCLDVDSGQLWQANEQGQTRTLHRDELKRS